MEEEKTRIMILVRCPYGYTEERSYVFHVIFNEFLGIPYAFQHVDGKEVTIQLSSAPHSGAIRWSDVLFKTIPQTWLTLSSIPATPLPTWAVARDLPEANVTHSFLPVIYGELLAGQRWFEQNGQEIKMGLDIGGSIFFMLTRYEEIAVSIRDEHARFPAKASLAYREGFLDRPIVDEYVEILWACMQRLWPNLVRKQHRYQVCLSHDVDEPLGVIGKPWFEVLKNIGGDCIKRHSCELAIQRFETRLRNKYDTDPYNTFGVIMDLSMRYGLKSVFFFKAARSNPRFDANYSLEDPFVQKLMQTIHERGHEIGLHPSYESYNRYEVLRTEHEKLIHSAEKLGISQERWGSRQHYLRWENPLTWQILDEVGLDYDTTLGFADHVGFRCGTCHEFPAFNLRTKKALRLRERPLIAMDTTMLSKQYMALPLECLLEKVANLSSTCRRFGGAFTLLWHNTSLAQLWQRTLYGRILEILL